MEAIVTGAGGFVGRKLVDGLIGSGHEVIAVVRDLRLVPHYLGKQATVLRVDYDSISDIASKNEVYGSDVWYHLGWAATSGEGRADVELQLKNVSRACTCVEIADNIGCKKFVNAGSIMEYEAVKMLMENSSVPGAGYIYSTAKLCADLMMKTICAGRRIEYLTAIISNIYGVGESSPRFFNSALKKMMMNEHVSCTSGEQLYDFIYIEEAVQKLIFIAEKGQDNGRYYIGNPKQEQLKTFILEMHRISKSRSELGFGEVPFNGPVLDYAELDPGKLERMGCYNRYSFEEGVSKTLRWMKENYG